MLYLNGQFVRPEEAKISVMDRGFLFGDGIYEVIPAYQGKLFGLRRHLERLERSLDAIGLPNPQSRDEWCTIFHRLLGQFPEEMIYLQITRGVEPVRSHYWGENSIEPTVLAYASQITSPHAPLENAHAQLLVDERWYRCDIKSVSLLGNILARQQAHKGGAIEALLHRKGILTEGSSSNLFLVRNGEIITPELSSHILGGITRAIVLELCAQNGLPTQQRPVHIDELDDTDELFITSSAREICPIVAIGQKVISNGKPGPVTRHLFSLYKQHVVQLVTGSIDEYEV